MSFLESSTLIKHGIANFSIKELTLEISQSISDKT